MGWVSLKVLDLDAEAARVRHDSLLEENVRLALWRMDSALSHLVGQENIRPYFLYSAYYPVNRPYGSMFDKLDEEEMIVPSPLLSGDVPYTLLHFQFDPDGRLTSPQVPDTFQGGRSGKGRAVREDDAVRLAELQALLDRNELLETLSTKSLRPAGSMIAQVTVPQPYFPEDAQEPQAMQQMRNAAEFQRRSAISQQNIGMNNPGNRFFHFATNVIEEAMTPLWIGEELVLARRVTIGSREYVQGCWLDWPSICKWLVEDVKDLLAAARFEPAIPVAPGSAAPGDSGGDSAGRDDPDGQGRVLASLPVRLVPGEAVGVSAAQASPIRLSLTIAWICVLLAAAAVVLLMLGALSLSERRGAFVSAVTHELRTPLTTLRIYTEMLAEGMVPDEGKRRHYLNTLRAESDRLGHLVENVLSYARLERGKPACRMEEIAVPDLAERIRERLAQRAGQAGMEIEWVLASGADGPTVRADPAAVEQILFNLVDNACKYAATGKGRTIRVQAGTAGSRAVIEVHDQGAGIAPHEAKHLFKPFRKSAGDAAHSAPGVGLGLALGRRLARMMGGELELDESRKEGACFVLSLPIV